MSGYQQLKINVIMQYGATNAVYKSPAMHPVSSNLFLFQVQSLIFLQFPYSFLLNAPMPTCNKTLQSPPPPPPNSTHPTSPNVFTALLSGKFRPRWSLHDIAKHSPALSVLFCHPHHLDFSVCSFQFLCLFCLCRSPLGSALQHVSVDASCCCPTSVYIKL